MNSAATTTRPLIVGELLFDCFPGGRAQLGGAPFNVAWHLRAFGLDPLLLSAVGEDDAGREALEAMQAWGLDTGAVSRVSGLPTGKVHVALSEGIPSFTIESPSAWDAIEAGDTLSRARAGAFSLLYHGSLALRDSRSRSTISALREALPGRIMVDLNLREGWWTPESIELALAGTSFLKINDAELETLDVLHGATMRASVTQRAARLGERVAIPDIVVTLGKRGLCALLRNKSFERTASSPRGELRDTVGAGDAFSSVLVLGRARGWPDAITLQRASDFAAKVCTIEGAVSRSAGFYQELLDAWERNDEPS